MEIFDTNNQLSHNADEPQNSENTMFIKQENYDADDNSQTSYKYDDVKVKLENLSHCNDSITDPLDIYMNVENVTEGSNSESCSTKIEDYEKGGMEIKGHFLDINTIDNFTAETALSQSVEEETSYSVHKPTRTGSKSDGCDKRNRTSYLPVIRKRTHMVKKLHTCDVCQKNCYSSWDLVKHKRSHTGEKPYQCDVCNKTFRQSYTLKTHKRIHTGERRHVCDVCDKAFNVSSDLIRHKRTHTGDKPYVCDVCQQRFNQSFSLIIHKRTHTIQMPYVCDLCPRTFTRTSDLTTHKRTHTGDKPYVCDVCHKAYSNSGNLWTHKRRHTAK